MKKNNSYFVIRGEISKRRYFGIAIIPFFLCIVVWFFLTHDFHIEPLDPVFLSTPQAVVKTLSDLLFSGSLLSDVWDSSFRVIIGFCFAALIAIPLGILIGTFRMIEALNEPMIDFIRYMPVPAFIPLCILWFGIGDFEKIIIIFIGTFFQLVLMIAENTMTVPKDYIESAATLGATKWEILRKVIFPAALPRMWDSLRITCGWAWTYLVVAELVGAKSGIGYMILKSQRYLLIPNIFVGILVIGILGIITDYIFKILRVKFFRWI